MAGYTLEVDVIVRARPKHPDNMPPDSFCCEAGKQMQISEHREGEFNIDLRTVRNNKAKCAFCGAPRDSRLVDLVNHPRWASVTMRSLDLDEGPCA
jgi:hypothetical protein